MWAEALVQAEHQRYCLNDGQFEEPAEAQLCPEPDVLACDGLNQPYLPMLFLPGTATANPTQTHMHNGEIMESSNNLFWPGWRAEG